MFYDLVKLFSFPHICPPDVVIAATCNCILVGDRTNLSDGNLSQLPVSPRLPSCMSPLI
jgi:hypothetical protein